MLNEMSQVVAGLRAADRSLQEEKGRSFLLRAWPWLLGGVISCFLLDLIFQLSPRGRLLLLAAVFVSGAGDLLWAWYIGRIHTNTLAHIARVLEKRDPALGSRLINLLQLESQTSDPKLGELTRQLARQAIANYAEELRGVNFAGLARTGRLARELRRAAVAGLLCAALLGIFHEISFIEVARFGDPWGDHPPYSFTRLEIVEPGAAGAQVVYNKSLVVKVKHRGHRPGEVYLTYFPKHHPEKAVTVPMLDKGSLGFYQEIGNIQSDLVLYAHTKNRHSLSKQQQVAVLLTPRLEQALVQVAPPAYTGIKAEEKPYDFKNVRALEGSRVRFRLESNRPLREGMMEVHSSETNVQHVALAKTGTNEVSGTVDARDSARLKFSLVDADGIASEDKWEGSLTVTHDLPPEIHIVAPNKDAFVAFNFKTEAQIEADDDYGLKMVRIHRALNQIYSPPKVITYDGIVRNARESVMFDFKDLGVQPGDVISFFAEAIDTAPQAHMARSETINLTVISEEDYNAFLREQNDISDIEGKYTELLDQFHDLVENQKALGEEADALKRKLSQASGDQRAALEQQLDRLLARQNELNQKLAKTADHMEHFVRDNPLYDVEQEFGQELKQKAQDIRDSTAANDQVSRDVAQRSSPGSGQRQLDQKMMDDFKKASDEQVAKLGGAEQQAREQVTQTIEDMSLMQELLKDFNRFTDLYQTQHGLSDQTRPYNRAGELDREDQLALKNLAGTEQDVADQLKDLGEKLRSDSENAKKLFPKAAQSAKDLADKMEQARMRPLAAQATDLMLAARGDSAFETADRLRSEMEKLFGECKSQGDQEGKELDTYLKLQRKMNPGRSFSQMMQSHKLGNGSGQKQGQGMGMGMGKWNGRSGDSGYAVMEGPSMGVMGNESFVSKSSAAQSGGNGRSQDKNGQSGPSVTVDKADVMKGVTPVNRKSDAVNPETSVDQYSDIVDQYFKAISK